MVAILPGLTTIKITRAIRDTPDWCMHISPDWNKCERIVQAPRELKRSMNQVLLVRALDS